MIGKRVEDRVEFDEDTRRKVLQKTGFCCAACGEKLDMVRHTIDHMIPISRGGTNEIDNLIGLCKMCNEYKDNLVYYPGDYYTYMMMTNYKYVQTLHEYVVGYLKDEIHKLNLHRYPLISPCTTAMLMLRGIMPKGYIRQLLFDIVYMRSDMRRANMGKVNFLKDYPYYGIIKRTTQKLIAILRIDYNVGRNECGIGNKGTAQLTVFDEWSDCPQKTMVTFMKKTGEVLATRYVELGIKLDEVCIASKNEKIPEAIYNEAVNNGFSWGNSQAYATVCNGVLNDREDLGDVTGFCVSPDRSRYVI